MSFIQLTTSKQEQTLINLDYVMLLSNTKKGVFVLFHDGNSFFCTETYDQLLRKLSFGYEHS